MKNWIARIGYQKRRAIFCFLFVLPWLAGFLIFTFKPLLDVLIYSFSRTKFLPDATIRLEYAALDNYYILLFVHDDFLTGLLDYLYQLCLMLPVIVAFSLLIAILLNPAIPGRRLFRVLFFLPVVLMQGPLQEIVTGLDAMSIAGVDSMFVFTFVENNLPRWLAGPIMYVIRQFITIIWYSGVQILLCLAGLQKLDRAMYEAASIDGASGWQAFWKITLPVSRPFILLSAIYTLVDLSTMDANPLILLLKERMFTEPSGFGYPSAVAVLYFVIMLLVAGLILLILGRRRGEAAQP